MNRNAVGKQGMLLAAIVSIALYFIAYFVAKPPTLQGNMGICFPSPNEWGLTPFWGWFANMLSLWLTCGILYFVNKEYSFVPGSDSVLPAICSLMLASNLWLCGSLSSSGLLALANLACMVVLFGCYRKRNAAQEMFVIATILALGSMIQYSFLLMLPVYLIGAVIMKCFRFKTLVAFVMGIVAPYWVALGLGIITPESFVIPTFINIFDGYATKSSLFVGMVNVGITVFLAFIFGLSNWVKLFSAHTERRLYNSVINILGIVTVCCIIFDSDNVVTYLATLYMIAAIQIANHFALRQPPYGGRWVTLLSLIYIAMFVLMTFLDLQPF